MITRYHRATSGADFIGSWVLTSWPMTEFPNQTHEEQELISG
jgi:hypothetical protein